MVLASLFSNAPWTLPRAGSIAGPAQPPGALRALHCGGLGVAPQRVRWRKRASHLTLDLAFFLDAAFFLLVFEARGLLAALVGEAFFLERAGEVFFLVAAFFLPVVLAALVFLDAGVLPVPFDLEAFRAEAGAAEALFFEEGPLDTAFFRVFFCRRAARSLAAWRFLASGEGGTASSMP